MKTKSLITIIILFLTSFQSFGQGEVFDLKGKKGFKDANEKIVIPAEFEDITEDGGLLKVEKNMHFGYYSTTGAVIIEAVLDSSSLIFEDQFTAYKSGKAGVLNTIGKELIPFEYESINFDADQHKYTLKKVGKLGFADSLGKIISKFEYESINFIKKDFITVKKNGLWGAVDFLNQELILCDYELISSDDPIDGLVVLKKKFIYYLYNQNRNYLFDYEFEKTPEIEDGLIVAKKDGLFGYINQRGDEIIKPQFSRAAGFRNGVADVILNGAAIRINKSGRKI